MYTRVMNGIFRVDARKINRRTHSTLCTLHSALRSLYSAPCTVARTVYGIWYTATKLRFNNGPSLLFVPSLPPYLSFYQSIYLTTYLSVYNCLLPRSSKLSNIFCSSLCCKLRSLASDRNLDSSNILLTSIAIRSVSANVSVGVASY